MERIRIWTVWSCVLISYLLVLRVRAQNNGYEEAVRSYISAYREIAIREMMAYRIPASITLAQGIFESNAGRSELAVKANNHFGIKCHKEWNGKKFLQDDETRNECFRQYNDPEESFRDHSYFLTLRERYKPLFDLDINDYKGWAKGLKACGYATNPNYAERLIKTIEDFQLYVLDVTDYSVVFEETVPVPQEEPVAAVPNINNQFEAFAEGPGKRMVYINNGLQFIVAGKNDNLKAVSSAFRISEKKIRKFNDMKPNAPIVAGQKVYLEMKKKKGAAAYHIVKPGETMYLISQSCGIRLDRLYRLNGMKPGRSLKAGQRLLLQ